MNPFTSKNLKKLNTKRGLKLFLLDKNMTPARALRILNYETKLKKLQEQLIEMQQWIEKKGVFLI